MRLTLQVEQVDGKTMIELSSVGLSQGEIIKILLQAVNKVVRKMEAEAADPSGPTFRDFLQFLQENFYAEETPQRKRLKTIMHNNLRQGADPWISQDKPLAEIKYKDLRKVEGVGDESCLLFEEIRDYFFMKLKNK